MTEATLPPQATTELGSANSVFQAYTGIDPVTGDWTDFDAEWSARDIETMLDRDGRARSVEQALTLPLRAAPLAFKPAAGDTGEHQMVSESLDRMATPLPLVLGQGAQSLVFRRTFFEKVFTTARGLVEYDMLAWRPPDSCTARRDRRTGRVTGFSQQVAGEPLPVSIPLNKAVIFTHGANRDPVRGVSEMAVSLRCYRDKQKIRALWMILLGRTAAPWVVARTQPGVEQGVANTLAKMRAGGVAAVSDVEGVDVLSVAGDAAGIFEAALKYLDSEMAGSVLAGFLDLTGMASRGAGSLALSKDQTDFFTSSMDAAAREIASTVRHQIVEPLVRLNRGPDAVVPAVTLGPISGASTDQMISLLQALAAAPSGQILPSEFIDELTVKVAGALDLDMDKITTAIKAATESAATSPSAAASAPVHGAVSVLHAAAQRAAA